MNLWGRACDIDGLSALADRYGLQLLFDSAQAFGCSYRGRMLGGNGRAEAFSFHATKVFHTLEGGAVLTDDDELAERVRQQRSFGVTEFPTSVIVGGNAKLNEISAAVGLAQLGSLAERYELNRCRYELYRNELHGVNGLNVVEYSDAKRSNYQYVIVEVDPEEASVDRDMLCDRLLAANVVTRPYFDLPCHRVAPYRRQDAPASRRRTVSLVGRLHYPQGRRSSLPTSSESAGSSRRFWLRALAWTSLAGSTASSSGRHRPSGPRLRPCCRKESTYDSQFRAKTTKFRGRGGTWLLAPLGMFVVRGEEKGGTCGTSPMSRQQRHPRVGRTCWCRRAGMSSQPHDLDFYDDLFAAVGRPTRDVLAWRSRRSHRRGWLVRRALLAADLIGLVTALLVTEAVMWGCGEGEPCPGGVRALRRDAAGLGDRAKLYGLYDRDEERTDHSTADDFVGVFHIVTVGTWLLRARLRWLTQPGRDRRPKLAALLAVRVVLVVGCAALARAHLPRAAIAYLQNTVIVGAGEVGQMVARKLLQHPEYGVNLVGFVDSRPEGARATTSAT